MEPFSITTITIADAPRDPSPERLLAMANRFADRVIAGGHADAADRPSNEAMATAAEVVARILAEQGTSADCLVNLLAETIDRHRSEAQP